MKGVINFIWNLGDLLRFIRNKTMTTKVMHIGQMIGGLYVYVKNTCSRMPETIEYVVVHGVSDNSEPISRKEHVITEYKIPLYRSISLIRDLQCLVKTIKIIRKEKPNVIHCHSAKGGVIGRLAGLFTGVKTFYTPHAFSFLSTPNKFKFFIFQLIEQLTRANSYLLACSNSERQMGITDVHYKDSRSLVWQNAVPDAALLLSDGFKCETVESLKSKRYISYIGRPCFQKNTEQLVEIVRLVHEEAPDVHFVLLGIGYYSPRLEEMKKQIERYNLNDVITLLPWLDQKSTLSVISHSLFYMSVARYEGLPLSVIEAMSLRKAIIASKVPGNVDCVKDGVNGRLIDINDIRGFVDAVVSLLQNEEMRILYGDNSRRIFENNFLLDNRINELENIYLNVK